MNEKATIENASHAFSVSQSKGITLEQAINHISNQADIGQTCARFFDIYISPSVLNELMNMGFLIGKHTGPMGDNITVISWAQIGV